MKYAGIINNDVVNGKGVCVSFWSQGCPHRCPGCHNPQTWEFNKGIEGDDDVVINHIIKQSIPVFYSPGILPLVFRNPIYSIILI